MAMGWPTFIAGYFVVWWLALFLVLPFGTRTTAQPDELTGWRGTPIAPRFWRTVLATTLLSALIWGATVTMISSGVVSFRHGFLAMPDATTK